jgi:uncharacterized membrane protein
VSALLAAAPALPLDEAGKYVAGAYVVFVALLLIYVAIMSARLQRIDKELGDLADIATTRAAKNAAGEAEGNKFERAKPQTHDEPPAGSGREAEHSGGVVPTAGATPSGVSPPGGVAPAGGATPSGGVIPHG